MSNLLMAALLMASPVQAAAPAASAPAPTVDRFGDWSLVCAVREGLPPCEVVQAVRRKDDGDKLLRFSFAYAGKDDRYGVQYQVPLGVFVQPEALVRLDDKTDVPGYRITRCEADGCYIDRVVSRADLEPFFKAQKGLIAVADKTGQALVLPLSLNGFADAMKAMTERNEAWARKQPVTAPATPGQPAKAKGQKR
ncbi:invasion associated locus B family protein [Sphingomonas sp. SORGH_AS_0879]|uniref:invasion associated locus B family protein n=1 Tax=Sphingomonas sp. SORGH_AS_0879 TaxID=3041790 RepID=UPI00278591E1|nr:invasion associated locus B family protein [Sphingomonas sp. SORGH_AS_0879]MDQ1231670.1 invasion protein IalB [Sphingomonas sp. SORGH_AS_0879]